MFFIFLPNVVGVTYASIPANGAFVLQSPGRAGECKSLTNTKRPTSRDSALLP